MKKRATCLLCLLAAAAGCSKNTGPVDTPAEPVYSRQYRQESVTVIVSCSETNIPSSGTIRFELDVHAPPDAAVEVPETEDLVQDFAVADRYAEPAQMLPNGKLLHRYVWLLVPTLPGTNLFQSMEIRAGGSAVATEPFPVVVRSLLPANLATLEIRDLAAPAELLPEEVQQRQRWRLLAGTAGVLALLAWAIRRKRRPKPVVVLLPHEAAWLALENLPDEALPRIQALTQILLAFIEGRFRLPTAGRTIPEILPGLPKKLLLGRRAPLERILIESEQIRFSNKIPPGFAAELEAYVRAFVKKMKEVPPCA